MQRFREAAARWLPPPRSALMGVLAGAAYALSVAPFHVAVASFLTVALIQMAARELPVRQVFTTGWIAGAACHLFIYWWIIETVAVFGNLPVAIGVVAFVLFSAGMGLYLALASAAAVQLVRRAKLEPPEAWPLAYVTIYLLLPQLFPFYLGVEYYILPGFHLNPPDVRVLSALICLLSAFGAEWYVRRRALFRETPPWRLGLWAAAAVVMLAVSLPRSLPVPARMLKVALVQTDFPLKHALKSGDGSSRFQKLIDLYREGVDRGAELVVFSESTLPFPYVVPGQDLPPERSYGLRLTDRLNEVVLNRKVPMIASGVGFDGDRVTNRSVFIEPMEDGTIRNQVYEKRRLLWFGEYVPFRDFWPKSDILFSGVAQFDPGPGPVLWTWKGLRILPSICYEAILPYFTRSIISGDGRVDLIINMTNDKWFGLTPEQEQHLMLATWRSAETGIPMIRATLNGTSAVVDGHGKVLLRSENGKAGVWIADVPVYHSPAPEGR